MSSEMEKLREVQSLYAYWNDLDESTSGQLLVVDRTGCTDCSEIGSDCHGDGECGGDGE